MRLRNRSKILAPLGIMALLAAGCGSSASAPAPRQTSMISIFEAPIQLASAPGPTLDLLRRLGVDYVRVLVRWVTVAPAPGSRTQPTGFNASTPASYPAAGWAPYDAIVREAAKRRMGVNLNISGPAPQWATGSGTVRGGTPGVWKPSAAQFGAFARAVGTRYSGHYSPLGDSSPLPRVSFWSIWNEPNLGEANLAPQAIDDSTVESSPMMYRALADAGWSALHQTGHGGDTILIGELAPYGQSIGRNVPGDFGYMVPLRFVRALYCVDSALRPLQGAAATVRGCPATAAGSKQFAAQHPVLFQATGYAVHPYPQGSLPPNVVLAGEPDFANLAALPKLERLLDSVTSTYGAPRKFPLYNTEYGYFTNPPFQAGAPPALAAGYLNWAEYISWRNPRIRSWNQYLLVDPPPGGPSKFVSGLEFANGARKSTFDAFRMPIFLPHTTQTSGSALEVWGCVRPSDYAALETGQVQRVQVELESGGRFSAIKTVPISDPAGYFDTTVRFPASGAVRIAWSYPHGQTVYSRSVSITTH